MPYLRILSTATKLLTKMASQEAMQRLTTRAAAAEQLIAVLKRQIEEIRKVSEPVNYDAEIEGLKRENAKLAGDISAWKAKLESAESANGVVQVHVKGEGDLCVCGILFKWCLSRTNWWHRRSLSQGPSEGRAAQAGSSQV